MKKTWGTIVLSIICMSAYTQPTDTLAIVGKIFDAQTLQPIVGATLKLGKVAITSDSNGNFYFRELEKGVHRFVASHVGYQSLDSFLSIQNTISLSIALVSRALFLDPLEIRALRSNANAPFAKTELSKLEIEKENIGVDLPFILNQQPSVVVNSDAGNGVGYTSMRIRGSDATRINITLNGIPYNDAEELGSYFVDLPDFSSSVNSIQIQRGVGTSSSGGGDFGATVNLSTNEFNEKAYAESNNSYGSFNTFKNTIKAGSGLLNNHFTMDARLSRISSNGYIDRATSNLQSAAFSTAYFAKNTSVRLNVFIGIEKTYQAWNGVPEDSLATHRTYNASGTEKSGAPYNNQIDYYNQNHYQLFLNQKLSAHWNCNTALFLSTGAGYFEEYVALQAFSGYGLPSITIGNQTIDTTNLIRDRWVKNIFYGQTFSLQYKNKNNALILGGAWTRNDAKRFDNIIWMQIGNLSSKYTDNNYQYALFPSYKTSIDIYAKWTNNLTPRLQSFADIQFRTVNYHINGIEGNPNYIVTTNYNFLLPKFGLTYNTNKWRVYFSYAMGKKEPARAAFSDINNLPHYETLHDFELGWDKKTTRYGWAVNAYYMYYQNQLVSTGSLNYDGLPITANVPNSFRAGLELTGNVLLHRIFNIEGNITISQNKIYNFTEYLYDDNNNATIINHSYTNISFSPSIVGGAVAHVLPFKNANISCYSKYVGKQYLDNTESNNRSLAGYFTEDISISYAFKQKLIPEILFMVRANNIFNALYAANGAAYPYINNGVVYPNNYYFPMATRNYMITVNIKL